MTWNGSSGANFPTTGQTTALGATVAAYIRGVRTGEMQFGGAFRDRQHLLGDIVNSSPAFVKDTNTVYVGANDGMLHAFRESDGAELWAVVPPNVLDTVKNLNSTAGDHVFYVDASPIAADIKVGGSWKTIVVFGLRRGGNHYYALDITDTTNPSFMWSFTDTKMGETWSEPAIGKVKIGSTDTYAMFVGGGYAGVEALGELEDLAVDAIGGVLALQARGPLVAGAHDVAERLGHVLRRIGALQRQALDLDAGVVAVEDALGELLRLLADFLAALAGDHNLERRLADDLADRGLGRVLDGVVLEGVG